MSSPAPAAQNPLDAVIRRAVAEGLVAFRGVERDTAGLRTALDGLAATLDDASGLPGVAAIRVALQRDAERASAAMASALQRRSGTLDRLRVAEFGRTHAGKSTLLEALVCGDGDSSSRGTTGYTTTTVLRAHGLLDVEDTPGIDARCADGADHERIAEEAARSADLILLVFDDLNQKASEFSKIAEWIARYQKPCIAVLNVKGGAWRRPEKAALPRQQAQAQLSVVQHADRIRRALVTIGLQDTPLVAVGAQNAAMARCTGTWKHEISAGMRQTLLDRHGRDGLLRVSNFGRFEKLLEALLLGAGSELRLAAMEGELAGTARALSSSLGTARKELLALHAPVAAQATAALRLVGSRNLPPDQARLLEGMTDLATVGTPELDQMHSSLVRKHVGDLRTTALGRAREVANREQSMNGRELAEAVFPDGCVEKAGAAVLQELAQFVEKRVTIADRELQSDLRALSDGVSGRGGRGELFGGVVLGALGLGLVAGLAAAAFFATGGVAFGVGLAVTVGAMFASWLGRKLRKSAAEKRATVRAKNLDAIEKTVRRTCEDLEKALAKQRDEIRAKLVAQHLAPMLATAHTLLRTADEVNVTLHDVDGVLRARGKPRDIRSFQRNAESKVSSGAPKGVDGRAWFLLGGDWVTATATDAQRVQTRADPELCLLPPLPRATSADVKPLEDLLVPLGSEDRKALQPSAATALAMARSQVRSVAVAGEYSSAKTSLIKRLHVVEGLPVPPTLGIAAGPSTDTVRPYAFGAGVLLLDTPGLQSGEAGHDEPAVAAATTAPGLLFCLNPQLLSSDAVDTRAVLAGDSARGISPGRTRALLVVQRIDALGACPVDEPDGFSAVVNTKRQEAARMLGAWGLATDPLYFVAADPFQCVGDRADPVPADYVGFESWDGFNGLRRELLAALLRQDRRTNVAAGARILALAAATRAAELRQLAAEVDLEASLDAQLAEPVADAATRLRALGDSIPVQIRSLLEKHAAPTYRAITAAADPEALKSAIDGAGAWATPSQRELEELASVVQVEAKSIATEMEERLQRRFQSPTGRLVASRAEERRLKTKPPGDPSAPGAAAKGASLAETAAVQLAARLGQDPKLLREEIKAAVGALKKWKPWEATKLAKRLNVWAPRLAVAGKFLGVLAVALDAWALWGEFKRGKALEAARKSAREELSTNLDELCGHLLEDDHGQPGIASAVRSLCDDVQSKADALKSQSASSSSAAEDLRARVDILGALVTHAHALEPQ